MKLKAPPVVRRHCCLPVRRRDGIWRTVSVNGYTGAIRPLFRTAKFKRPKPVLGTAALRRWRNLGLGQVEIQKAISDNPRRLPDLDDAQMDRAISNG